MCDCDVACLCRVKGGAGGGETHLRTAFVVIVA